MLALRDNETVVRRVRLECRQLDPLAAQLRLENVLQTVELHPAWLSRSAIVCVRRVKDPLPHTLNLQGHTESVSPAWRQALAAAVHEKIRGAARPSHGENASESDAVIFQDRAELLACLASDSCAGLFAVRWWWRTLFKGGNLSEKVFTAWSDAPEYVPAALERLAGKQQLKHFVRSLSAQQARELLRSITQSFALQALQTVLDQELPAAAPVLAYSFAEPLPTLPAIPQPSAPWHRYAPEYLDQTFRLEQQCFVGVALSLTRAPAVVRSPSFAAATLKWLRAAVVAETVNHRPPSIASPPEVQSYTPEVSPSISENPVRPVEQISNEIAVPVELSASLECGALAPLWPKRRQVGALQGGQPRAAATIHPSATTDEISPTTPVAEKSSVETSPIHLPLDEVQIETELGGVFYLINVGLFLGLYGDFTTPLEPGLTLPIFDFVALTAQRLLSTEHQDDPVWNLLAQLAGRNESDPVDKFIGDWDQWLDTTVPHVRARLALAFGMDDDTEMAQLLCAHRATIRLTAVHLDISFALSEHPVEIRAAGLDRDPGWVPAAGRFIRFHYQ